MRKVTFGGACTLDNFFARKDGGMDWLMWSDEAMELTKDLWPNTDTFIMGRKTYEVAISGQGEVETADDSIRTFIFSRTLPAGKITGGAEVVASDPGDFVRDLKQQDGKDICIMGGGDLARTLLEAASSSKPIVATDVPGCHNIVSHNINGLLCQLKNVDDLANKMNEMANLDNETLKRFGVNGRKKVELEFNEQVVINKYLETLSSLKAAS